MKLRPHLHPRFWPASTRALAQLDVHQREALLLKYAEGLEYTEMSAMTGIGESALKMRVKRGIERLRSVLGPADV